MRKLAARLVPVLVMVAVVGTACDDEKTGLTKEDWIKAAAAICTQGTEDFNALFETGFPTTPDALGAFFEKAAPIVERQVSDLRELEAPEGQEDEIDKVLDSGDKAVDDFEAAATDQERASEVFSAEGGRNIAAFENGMADLGVPECAEDEGEDDEGEDENIPDPSTFSPEKAAFVEAADAICTEIDAKLKPVEEEVFENFPPPLELWSRFLAVLIPTFEDALDRYDALEPPTEDAAQIDDDLAQRRALVEELKRMKEAADAGDQEAFDELAQGVFPQFDELDRADREYGFQVCGSEDEDEGDDGEESETGEDGEDAEDADE